ncbi:cell division protein FtsA [Parabacteroides sp. AF17-28]|uniref:cell division protein FtsA n=1 Tax=Parabacteroides sp. AF17-28 TaxID=2292241 RepID=UPI001F2AAC45|nr:cell division protein FtsA [Parabacteroides sp. AF17-28]
MAYTDFIAAIDLGSSHMVGMVGAKGPSGALSIIAYEVENSETCIRRGCVYNIKDAAGKIVRLIRKLENKLGGSRIGKVYIGVGGQSLRTISHAVSRVIGDGTVTEEILQELDKECRQYHPDMLDVLEVAPPAYFLDNQPEAHPVGMGCSRIDARYKLIVGRPSLRHAVTTNMTEQIKLDVAGTIVSPLALADLILTEQEKDKGCALVDFGAGVTSVTIYKDGSLAGLYVIPLGSQLITRDLMSLGIPEKEAERVKRTYGNAIWEKDNEQQVVSVDLADGQHAGEVKLSDINMVVEARSREIIENIYARLEDAGVVKTPGYSVVIAGNGAALKNMREALGERFRMDVRYASVRKDLIADGEMIANNPEYTTAVALLLKGRENCAAYVPETEKKKEEPVSKPIQTAPETVAADFITEEEKKETTEQRSDGTGESDKKSDRGSDKGSSKTNKNTSNKKSEEEGPSLFGKWFSKKIDDMSIKINDALKDEK